MALLCYRIHETIYAIMCQLWQLFCPSIEWYTVCLFVCTSHISFIFYSLLALTIIWEYFTGLTMEWFHFYLFFFLNNGNKMHIFKLTAFGYKTLQTQLSPEWGHFVVTALTIRFWCVSWMVQFKLSFYAELLLRAPKPNRYSRVLLFST